MQSPPFDLEKMTWKCHCCDQERMDKFIKVFKHDIASVYGLETGMASMNVRYCMDVPSCLEKASNRQWVLKKFLNKD